MEDLEGLKTTDALPGEFPYLRGTKKKIMRWFVRQEIKSGISRSSQCQGVGHFEQGGRFAFFPRESQRTECGVY